MSRLPSRWAFLCLGLIITLNVVDGRHIEPIVHDSSFTPDEVLRVSRRTISVGGIFRYTTLVNGSLPGPVLRLSEDRVIWIRVHNDMPDANLTMVILPTDVLLLQVTTRSDINVTIPVSHY